MFEGFDMDARHAVVRARDEADRAGCDHIGCEHLLLGLLAEPGAAAQALTAAGLEITELRAGLASGQAPGDDPLDASALASVGIDLDAVRRAADAAFGQGALDRVGPRPRRGRRRVTPRLPLHSDAKNSLRLALRATVSMRHASISTGHVLVGLIDQEDNAALRILTEAGIDSAALRADVSRRMTAVA